MVDLKRLGARLNRALAAGGSPELVLELVRAATDLACVVNVLELTPSGTIARRSIVHDRLLERLAALELELDRLERVAAA